MLEQRHLLDELSSCSKRLKRGKSPGIDGVLAHMLKDAETLSKCACCGCSVACMPATSLNVFLLDWLLRCTSLGEQLQRHPTWMCDC